MEQSLLLCSLRVLLPIFMLNSNPTPHIFSFKKIFKKISKNHISKTIPQISLILSWTQFLILPYICAQFEQNRKNSSAGFFKSLLESPRCPFHTGQELRSFVGSSAPSHLGQPCLASLVPQDCPLSCSRSDRSNQTIAGWILPEGWCILLERLLVFLNVTLIQLPHRLPIF